MSENESEIDSEEELVVNSPPNQNNNMSGYTTPTNKKKSSSKYKIDSELSGMMNSVLNVSSNFNSKKVKKKLIEKNVLPCGAPYLLSF